jgi:hypothetical protein
MSALPRARVESNCLSIRRPTRASGRRVEVGELNQTGSVASGHPDFISAATGRFEGDLTSIRRELRTAFHSSGMYKPVGQTGRTGRNLGIELPSPDTDVCYLTGVHQSVSSNRRLDSLLTELQSLWLTSIP